MFIIIVGLFGIRCKRTSAPSPKNNQSTYQVEGRTVYVYGNKRTLTGKKKVPLVLFMNGTGLDPQQQAKGSGWANLAKQKNFIVISPSYNDSEQYPQVPHMVKVVKEAQKRFPIDKTRIYSTGFSNGGAISVALTSTHPAMFAGIAAYGWMIDLHNKKKTGNNNGMPFLFLNGTREFIEKDAQGNNILMDDDRQALRSLFAYNNMKPKFSYKKTPYFGYQPNKTTRKLVNSVNWTFNYYNRKGFKHPFAETILVDKAQHVTHSSEAKYTWSFFNHFRRKNGKIVETK